MKNKLPVVIENLTLPKDEFSQNEKDDSYGYASVLFLLSVMVIGWSAVTIVFLGR